MESSVLKKINVLYVEDDESIRPLLARSLERRVKNLYVAVDGEDGYNQYLIHEPDIVVTDIKMPKMSGLEMSRLIRVQNAHVPIIVISAHSEAVNFLEAIELGVTNYILKPVDKNKLLNMLESNAKTVLFEKEAEEQKHILQEVINLQPSIVFSSSNKKVLFANKYFMDFFSFHLDKSDFKENSEQIYESLRNNHNIMVESNETQVPWIDYILEHANQSFRVRINKNNKMRFFNVTSKEIISHDEKSVVVLLNESL